MESQHVDKGLHGEVHHHRTVLKVCIKEVRFPAGISISIFTNYPNIYLIFTFYLSIFIPLRNPLQKPSTMLAPIALFAAGLALFFRPTTSVVIGRGTGFGVFGSAGATNSNANTRIRGNLGVSPASCTSATGFGIANYVSFFCPGSPQSTNAKADLAIAYTSAANTAPSTPISGVLNGVTLTPGTYKIATTASLGGSTLTFNGAGTYIIQVGTALKTTTGAIVALKGGATACNIWWQVGSSATIFAGAIWKGTILAGQAISVGNAAVVNGTLYAGTSSVTLINNDITGC